MATASLFSLLTCTPALACASDALEVSTSSASNTACEHWKGRVCHGGHTLSDQDYHDALETFVGLDDTQKTAYGDTYLAILKWHLPQTTNTPERLMNLAKDLFLLDAFDDATLAGNAFAAHPERNSLYKTKPLDCAFTMAVALQIPEAAALYSLALTLTPQDFTLTNFRNAALAFGGLRQVENGLKNYRQMMARIPHSDLKAEDFISAAGCFIASGRFEEAKTYLGNYFVKEENAPHPMAYRLSATIATHEDHIERACEYWLMAIGGGSPMHYADYANAASCFTKIGNMPRAALLWQKALNAKDFSPSYDAYVSACDAFTQVRDFSNALTCANAFMAHRATVHPSKRLKNDLKLAATLYSKNGLLTKSIPIWDHILNNDPLSLSTEDKLRIACDFFDGNALERALQIFRSVPPKELDKYKDRPAIMERIQIIKIHMISATASSDPVAPASSSHKARLSKDRTKAILGRSTPSSSATLGELKLTLGRNIVARVESTLAKMHDAPSETLKELRASVGVHQQSARELLARLSDESVPHQTISESVSSSSSSSSSSSMPSSSSSAPTNPLFELQRLGGEIERLEHLYTREKTAFERAAAKARLKEMVAVSASENPEDFSWSSAPSSSHHTRAPKIKTRGTPRPGPSRTPKSEPSQSAHVSSSSTPDPEPMAPALSWRITPTAQKQLKELQKVPGFYKKLSEFRQELEEEPWGRRGHTANHASGRAKQLSGSDRTIFSRRLAKGERFFYRVEKDPQDRVAITILGLKGHDL
ncbi:MAG: hypothetical protein C0514_01300 [Candidatus Puniceispirillum sp.]|nr:hypothetical protein [Candidatus Puniceispirillum sp.]